MTTFSLPPHAPTHSANASASLALANGGGQSDDQDGSASAAFLGALNDAGGQGRNGAGGSTKAEGTTAQSAEL